MLARHEERVKETYVKDLDIGGTVDSSADADTLFLTTGQRDAAFTDLRKVTVRKEL